MSMTSFLAWRMGAAIPLPSCNDNGPLDGMNRCFLAESWSTIESDAQDEEQRRFDAAVAREILGDIDG